MPKTYNRFSLSEKPLLELKSRVLYGALAQLVERDDGIVEASGSRPLRSTSPETFSEMIMSPAFSFPNPLLGTFLEPLVFTLFTWLVLLLKKAKVL